MRNRTMALTVTSLATTAALALTSCATTDTGGDEGAGYPTETITLLVPGAAGSSNDSIARQLVTLLEPDLGRSIVVQNFATEIQGMAELKKSDPDGYTIALAPQAITSLIPLTQETGYGVGTADFDVVAQTDSSPVVLLVPADSPYKTLADFVSAGKKMSVGAPSGRGVPAVDIELLAQESGLDYDYVGFPPGEQIVAVLNGTVAAALSQTPLAAQYVADGQLRALALFSDKTLEGLDAPLATDGGYDVTFAPTRLVYVPKGTPTEVIDRLAPAFEKAVASEAFIEFAAKTSFIPSYLGPAESTAALEVGVTDAEKIATELGWTKQ